MGTEQSNPLCEAARKLRLAIGDTQQQFAQRLQLAISTVVRYELTRPAGGAALALLARTAEDAGQQELADTFLAALGKELGLHKNHGVLHAAWDEDGTKNEGFLLLSLETPEQQSLALAFYTAFMVHTRPGTFRTPPTPEAQASASKMLQDLKRAADATWPGKKAK